MPNEHDRFRKMIEDSQDWFWEFDEHANFTYASPRIRDLLGYDPEELIGLNAFDLMSPDEAERVRKHFNPRAERFLPFKNLVNINIHKDGHEVAIESSGTPIFDEECRFRGYRGIDRDITPRLRAEDDLRKSEKLFQDFFKFNPVASILTSQDGTVHMINPAFEKISGLSAEEAVGRTTFEIGIWREPADRALALAKIMEDGELNNLEFIIHGKNGQPMTWLISSRLIDYEGEKMFLSIILDVTEQREAHAALRKLDQAKSDFIRMAAHELQTPLVSVMGYAELLENSNQTLTREQQRAYASIICSNAEILSRLVNDLLDVEKIQLGYSLSIAREKVSFAKMVKRVVASLTPKYPEHRFILTHTNDLPETLHIDEGRITQVLTNLLVNAVRYSPEGGAVEVFTVTDESSVKISIRDYGLGMTPEQVERIFDKFYRANPENPRTGGLGLGMSIVKQIVEDHNGDISISSKLGAGTTVTLTLPRLD